VISWSLINRIRIKPIKNPAQRTNNVHFIAILPLKAIPLHKRGQTPGMVELEAAVPQKETATPYADFKAIKAAVSIEDARKHRESRPHCPTARCKQQRDKRRHHAEAGTA
jgi:hypothetical protein